MSAQDPDHRPRQAAVLIAQMAFGLLAMTICLPSVQEWGAIFGAPQSQVQLTFSGYVLTYGALQLLYGPLSDRHGRRRLILLGLGLAALASLAAAFAPTLEWLIAARVLQGTGCAACMVVGRAALQDLFEGPERTRMMAYVGMAMGLCPPLATVIGGQLHVHFGWASNFVVLAVVAVLLALAVARWLPAPRAQAAGRAPATGLLASYGQLVHERGFVRHVLVLGMTSAAFYSFLGGAPMVLGSYGIGPGTVGLYIMLTPLSYIVGNYLTSHLVHRRGERWMMKAGQLVTLAGIGLMLVLALAGVRAPLAFSIPLMLMGVGNGLLIPPALAATMGLVPALAGAAAAVAGVMQQLMGAVGGWLVGFLPFATAVPLGLQMLAFTLASVAFQLAPRRGRATA